MANSEREDYESRDKRRREPEFYSKEVVQFGKGLFTDSSPQMQPKGTLRFALNCVDETEEGDMLFPSNMESNIEDSILPEGYIPIGKVYIGEGETALFLTTLEGESEIGIYSDKTGYTTKLNDPSLNFKITHQIDAVYRLRRGCDQTIYWTDNLNPIRQYVFNRPEDYIIDGTFNIETLKLFKTWNKVPNFDSFEVLESGILKAGSYNFTIQYLDSDLNPTEWIITTDTINIYHDNITQSYRDIEGSTNATNDFQNWGESTGKSIKINLSNLDTNFNFYRIGIIEATSGTGLVTKVLATCPISTRILSYIFTGNAETVIPVEEIAQFSLIVDTAQSIEQIENKLLLGNIKGKQVNFCELQQYASKIVSNYVVETVILDQIEDFNSTTISEAASKDPLINTKKVGYMPGEIYSFGIIYYFKDGSSSPVYHIPGRPISDTTNISNMPLGNSIESRYTDTSNCSEDDYWGKDFTENNIEGANIRHHRFPTRAEAGIGFVRDTLVTETLGSGYKITAIISVPPSPEGTGTKTFKVTFGSDVAGLNISTFTTVYSQEGETNTFSFDITTVESDTPPSTDIFFFVYPVDPNIDINVQYTVTQSVITNSNFRHQAPIFGIEFSNILIPDLGEDNKIIGYKIVRNERTEVNKTILDTGILFPVSEYRNFLGYSHSIPNLKGANFTVRDDVYAFINPEFIFNKKEYTQNNIEFINAGEFKRFDDSSSTSVAGRKVLRGDRVIENYIEDAYPGTTFDPEIHSGSDKDGLDLHTASRFRDTEFKSTASFGNPLFGNAVVKKVFYLDALSNISLPFLGKNQDVFNVSSDNKIGIVQLENKTSSPFRQEAEKNIRVPKRWDASILGKSVKEFADVLKSDSDFKGNIIPSDYYQLQMKTYENTPYFYMKRTLSDPYSDFRYITYFSEHDNIIPIEQNQVKLFNGDTYISPMTYTNSFYHDIKPKSRKTKSSWWKKIVGALLVVAGAIGAFFSLGLLGTVAAIGIGLLGAAAGVSAFASGIKMDKIAEVYNDEYEKGLKYVSRDGTTNQLFVNQNTVEQYDDEIQWYNDVINGLWFETQVNIGVRQGTTLGIPSFIPAPFEFMTPDTSGDTSLTDKSWDSSNAYFRRRAIEKISILEPEADDSRLYLGYAIAEFYEVNKDFQRRNKEKPYFHLGLEYDCCSDCVETFPHRIHYSEQSFQEELTDNFRVFLPNNYIDLDGETGKIINIFKIQNELFIHTEEAVWKMPKNYQERITDEIVSFIGTGSYFSIPPQKLIDDESGNSFGTKHKWSRLKTPSGYFFVSESQNAICMFDGNKISNIADLGTYYWFYNNIPLLSNSEHRDNPSNPLGVGFIFAYDSKKKLVFLTKKDKLPTGEDVSWTMSFNLKKNSWGSWHSFLPNFYFQTSKNYYSFIEGDNNIWKHNVLGNYQTYYGKRYPYILEYVLVEGPLQNKTFEDITVFSESKKYDPISKTFHDMDSIFFNNLLVYNSRQCSGILNIVVKDKEDMDFFMNQVSNTDLQNITADNNEKIWTINELRDMVVTKDTPIFISDVKELQDNYFIDKKLNPVVIDYNKDWTQIESFRDKYLVVRFIFDKFADIKLITNFSANTEKISIR